jgi:hypothetical protein
MVNEILKTQPHFINGKKIDCKIAIPKNKLNNTNENIINKKSKKEKEKKIKNNNSNITNNQSSLYFRKLFVGGLHPSLKTEALIDYFSQFGEIEKGIIMTDKITGKSRGFGFIIFSKKETVDKIMSYSNCLFLYGKWIECKRAQPKNHNMKMLNDNVSFPKLNYQNNFLFSNVINEKSFDNNNDIIFSNDNLEKSNNNIFNENVESNKNLFLYQNYIPKEQVKLFVKNNENSFINEKKNNFENDTKINSLKNNYNNYNNINNNLLYNNKNKFNEKKEIRNIIKYEKDKSINKNGEKDKNLLKLNNKDNKTQFQDYFNNYIKNPSSYNYFHYKLLDSNGEEVTKLNNYNKKIGKIRLFPEELNDSFEKNKNSNSESLKSNKTNTISSDNEILSEQIEKNNINDNNIESLFGYDRNKKDKSRSSGYSNESYKPY